MSVAIPKNGDFQFFEYDKTETEIVPDLQFHNL